MSDDEFDDLDALFDEFDDDDVVDAAEENKSNCPVQKEEDASEESPANVSANEEKLRSELEEMKLKMKMMEEMLKNQSMTTPVKSLNSSKIKKPENSNTTSQAKKEVTPMKTVTPSKPSLSDKFKNVLDTKSSDDNPSTSASQIKPPPNKTPSKCQLSETFGTALHEAESKRQAPKPSNIKPVSFAPTPEKLDKCPHSGIRISNRVTAKSDFNCAVATRKFVKIQHLPLFFKDKQEVPGDWVTSGVIVRKAGPFKSKTGNDYSIWTLSDLISLDNTLSLFLFKNVHIEHRKEQIGTVVALLNPNFMPPRDQEKGKKSDLAFTLDDAKKLLRMGMAADYGTCKNTTKGGQQCNNFINKSLTQYCDFHIVKVHAQLRNKRMALNGSYTPLQPGMNKLQKFKQDCQAFSHKGNVYYPNVKAEVTDKPEVAALKKKGMMISTPLVSTEEFNNRLKVQSTGSIQLKRALEASPKPSESSQSSKRARLEKLDMTSCKTFFKKHVEAPKLGSGLSSGGFINLNTDGKKASMKAKAISLAKKGAFTAKIPGRKRHELTPDERRRMKERSLGLEKEPPPKEEIILNSASDMLCSKGPIVTKRTASSARQDKENKSRKSINGKSKESEPVARKGILSAAFGSIDTESIEGKRIMKAQSMNVGVIREQEIERTTDYFNAMEKFEHNEEKLLSIKEIKVTVYICRTCNTATSKQLPKCIEEKHPVKKGPAVKKFFKCGGCSQRTDVVGMPYPDHSCMKCGKSAWVKCSMYHEKKGVKLESERLVVRAEDVEIREKFA
ncbi:protein MCM10 homolog [Bolinopsis microptera]|uniref:protein MCM10 homolog n=1 Tax=Bolinopsis microptera TaxID=2820187 RepID=UPI003079B493